ncbi:MAG: atpB [Patescibacteria group bacterium]|nr:atpB [Patescibacteria group bacterium]
MIWKLAATAAHGPHVSLVAEPIFNIGPLNITNSTLLGVVGGIIMFWLLLSTVKRIKTGKHNRLSIAVLWLFDILFGTVEEILGSRDKAKKLAPLAITIFLFILINNWLGTFPFVGPLTWHGEPLFRGLAADLNFTAALALITMVTAQIWAHRSLGLGGNLGRYFGNPFKDFMHVFSGFLELIAEFSRLIALAMRLFGNIFGGEVLLLVMAYISGPAAPIALIPFMLIEIFVGAIQAYVFFMLTVVFVSLGANHGHDDVSSEVDESRTELAAPGAPV